MLLLFVDSKSYYYLLTLSKGKIVKEINNIINYFLSLNLNSRMGRPSLGLSREANKIEYAVRLLSDVIISVVRSFLQNYESSAQISHPHLLLFLF